MNKILYYNNPNITKKEENHSRYIANYYRVNVTDMDVIGHRAIG